MSTNAFRAQMSDLRWLVNELEHELDAPASSPFPRVHRFLLRYLASKIIKVAAQVRGSLTEHPPGQQGPSDGACLVEQPAYPF